MDLQTLIDKQAIRDLQVAYSRALDEKRYDDLDQVFVPDAVADYGEAAGNQQGLDEIKAACREALDVLTTAQHLNGNHWAEIDGDTARAGCQLMGHQRMDGTLGGDHFSLGARYDDELVRTDDGWRITRRTLTLLWAEGNATVRYDR